MTDDGCERYAHAAHADGAEYIVFDFTDDGHFFMTHAHDAAPSVFNFKIFAGDDDFAEESFEFFLDEVCGGHFGCRFGFEGFVAGSAEEDAVVEVTEVVEAFVKVESAFEGQFFDRRGEEDLTAGGDDIEVGEELFCECVCADEQLGCVEGETGDLGMDRDVLVVFFPAGDLDAIEDGDADGLDDLQERLAEPSGMQLGFAFIFYEILGVRESELQQFVILDAEGLLFAYDLFEEAVEVVDVAAKVVDIPVLAGCDEFVASVAFVSYDVLGKQFCDLF